MHLVSIGILAIIVIAGCAYPMSFDLSLDSSVRNDSNYSDDKRDVLYLDSAVDGIFSEWQASPGSLRSFEERFESTIEKQLEPLRISGNHSDASLDSVGKKWLTSFSSDAADPDNGIPRLLEYLHSLAVVEQLLNRVSPIADHDAGEIDERFEHRAMKAINKRSLDLAPQWCGPSKVCKDPRLYKLIRRQPFSTPNGNFLTELPDRITNATESENARSTYFFVLGYEFPWDADKTSVRYGVEFFFQDTPAENPNTPAEERKLQLLGAILFYASEATPFVPPQQPAKDDEEDLTTLNRLVYMTGWPVALVIGVKNAAFEIAKMPFSLIGGTLSGRDWFWIYAIQNLKNAVTTLSVEAVHLPSYGLLPGLVNLVGETPLIGQLFQFQTGPEYLDGDEACSKHGARRLIFLSRGIYGGNKWGQDIGLWAAATTDRYPEYTIYSPPYRHGTVTDVIWSMFNLSHGPGYSEANYVMNVAKASPCDHLYLAGHSGGVQRSASASRILSNHRYSVQKVVGIAGPSIGQAYVNTQHPEPFRVYLNYQSGQDSDIVSVIGSMAYSYSNILDTALIRLPFKRVLGGIIGLFDDQGREWWFKHIDRVGFSNATIIEVERKKSSLHTTPLRVDIVQPIFFDAYIRGEFMTAFQENLETTNLTHAAPKPGKRIMEWLSHPSETFKSFSKEGKERMSKKEAIPWER